jgi:hypothetical protein
MTIARDTLRSACRQLPWREDSGDGEVRVIGNLRHAVRMLASGTSSVQARFFYQIHRGLGLRSETQLSGHRGP